MKRITIAALTKEDIREARLSHGLTSEQMAKALGLSLTHFKDIETGRNNIFPKTEDAFKKALPHLDSFKPEKFKPTLTLQKVREIRMGLELTRVQLSEILGFYPGYISEVERGNPIKKEFEDRFNKFLETLPSRKKRPRPKLEERTLTKEILKKTREDHGLTQKEMAKILDMTEPGYLKVERAESPVTISERLELAFNAALPNLPQKNKKYITLTKEEVRSTRVKYGLEQMVLAKMMGCQKAKVGAVERGETNITYEFEKKFREVIESLSNKKASISRAIATRYSDLSVMGLYKII